MPTHAQPKGFILAIVVVFGAVFLTVGLALVGYLLEMQKAEQQRIEKEQAFAIAEAGLDYYGWHLAHFPSDLQDGTGAAGPYAHSYADPEGGTAGTFSLSVNGNLQCGQPTAIDITSTGATAQNPTRTATVEGRYAKESVASYSYIVNSAVYAGSTRTIYGRYHSNNGIRMDADNKSTVESSVSTWNCTSSYGCSPAQSSAPGVVGTGSTPALWTWPVPQIDFASISVNLATLKTAAQTAGIYYGPAAGTQGQRGYHLIFNGDGTVTVRRVTGTTAVWGESPTGVWAQEYNIISSEVPVATRTVPSDCGAIFIEDKVWVEGVVKGKVTVAAADLTGSGYNPDAILSNNITYTDYLGADGLTVVAANNVLIPLNSPDTMELHGVFIAQNGYYGRNYYCRGGGCAHSVPSSYQSDILQSTLTTVGTIVSNGRTGTAWTSGGAIISGYQTRNDSYDGNLATDPPPFTPYTSSQFNFVRWRQQ